MNGYKYPRPPFVSGNMTWGGGKCGLTHESCFSAIKANIRHIHSKALWFPIDDVSSLKSLLYGLIVSLPAIPLISNASCRINCCLCSALRGRDDFYYIEDVRAMVIIKLTSGNRHWANFHDKTAGTGKENRVLSWATEFPSSEWMQSLLFCLQRCRNVNGKMDHLCVALAVSEHGPQNTACTACSNANTHSSNVSLEGSQWNDRERIRLLTCNEMRYLGEYGKLWKSQPRRE